MEFHETEMGRQFYEVTMPRIADALERVADGLPGGSIGYEAVERYAELAFEQMGDIFIDPDEANDPELPTYEHIRGRVVYSVMEAILDALTEAGVRVHRR